MAVTNVYIDGLNLYHGMMDASLERYRWLDLCSRRCMQRNARAVARARRHDVWIRDVRRYAVFENHGWVCHICHEPIDPTLPLNDPMVATLDHVIPLVGRGPHVESNLRPAHMMCNSLKSMDEHGQPCTVS